ncbi:C-terminal binding protein [candidate division KSB1 bacterium]|nr:C-terminal binding protein [candidate division KSB1 bacterium]
MPAHKVLYTDHGFASIASEKQIIETADAELIVAQCKTAEEVIALAPEADALLVQWAPITAEVIRALRRCKVIVRLGIGVDNVAVDAATAHGIPVCNVPDYCIDEVADHTVALALALARQIPFVDRRVRDKIWQITPPAPMPAFKDMIFATMGLGRIAQAVHRRMQSFGCTSIAHDPFASREVLQSARVAAKPLDEVFAIADILSLHCPLMPETHHLINTARLRQMKATAILINTARGALVDTVALAQALREGTIAAAGLDVFEPEPLPDDHPLRFCERAVLTSHIAWYSERSVPALQRKAAEEIVRGLRGEALKNQINIIKY